MNPLETLIEQLSTDLRQDPPLHLDVQGRCRILVEEKLPLQLETDTSGEACLTVAEVAVLGPGRFRDLVFKNALRANGLSHRSLIFAWLEKKQTLVLFEKWSLRHLNRERNFKQFNFLVQEALTWKNSLENGIFPSLSSPHVKT